jgi:hypothetical protein
LSPQLLHQALAASKPPTYEPVREGGELRIERGVSSTSVRPAFFAVTHRLRVLPSRILKSSSTTSLAATSSLPSHERTVAKFRDLHRPSVRCCNDRSRSAWGRRLAERFPRRFMECGRAVVSRAAVGDAVGASGLGGYLRCRIDPQLASVSTRLRKSHGTMRLCAHGRSGC